MLVTLRRFWKTLRCGADARHRAAGERADLPRRYAMSGRQPVARSSVRRAAYRERTVPIWAPSHTGARRTGDGHDAAADPARHLAAEPPPAPAPHPARRLRRRAGESRIPLRGGTRAEGGILRAARLDLRRPRAGARRSADRG